MAPGLSNELPLSYRQPSIQLFRLLLRGYAVATLIFFIDMFMCENCLFIVFRFVSLCGVPNNTAVWLLSILRGNSGLKLLELA